MKTLRKRKIVLVGTLVLIAIGLFKFILIITASPKITVDYVAEYNKFARPQNYDPNDNAAPYYQKAFDAYVDIPDELPIAQWKPYTGWPTDFNSSEQVLLEQWLTSNSQAFEFFKIAVNKPSYWLERQVRDTNLPFDIMLPELATLRELTRALIWDAKVKVIKEQFQPALENVLDCYKAGSHKCRSNLLLTDQHNGLEIKQAAIKSTLIILDKSKSTIASKVLKSFQDAFMSELAEDNYVPSMQAEKFFLYDGLQWMFLDNGKGTGRLSWRICWGYVDTCSDLSSGWQTKWLNLKRRLSCFIGPTRNETAEQIEQVIAISDQMMTKTPWQVKNESRNYLTEIKNIKNSNLFLDMGTTNIDPKGTFYLYYNTKVRTEALVAVLAILRFKADTGRFPETLNDLVSKDYLRAIPQDPYSNSSLIYKISEDNFILYGVGENFKDDGGKQKTDDIVFWPPRERPNNIDSNLPIQETNQPSQKLSE